MAIGDNLKAARIARGLSQKALADLVGVEQQTIEAIENGRTKQPRKTNELAAALQITPEALLFGDQLAASGHGVNNVQLLAPRRMYQWPLVSFVSAGMRNEAVEPYENGDAPTVEFESEPTSDDLALQVRGDSMLRPDGSGFPDGCYIAVRRNRRPKNKEFVVVRFANTDEATFKQLVIDGPVKLLKPLNPNYPTHTLAPDAVIIGTVCEKRSVEKF